MGGVPVLYIVEGYPLISASIRIRNVGYNRLSLPAISLDRLLVEPAAVDRSVVSDDGLFGRPKFRDLARKRVVRPYRTARLVFDPVTPYPAYGCPVPSPSTE